MRIKPAQPALLPELLSFLRRSGCIAYSLPGSNEIEALLPDHFGAAERRALRPLLERWHDLHPDVPVEAREQ